MIALADFVGIIDGAEKAFRAGDVITEAEASELGLETKPNLASSSNEITDEE